MHPSKKASLKGGVYSRAIEKVREIEMEIYRWIMKKGETERGREIFT